MGKVKADVFDDHHAEIKRVKRDVKKLIEKWIPLLRLDRWESIIASYVNGKDEDEPNCFGKAKVQWQYMRAEVIFYLPNIIDESPEELERLVVHELMHVMLNEMREYDHGRGDSINHEERVATTLQMAFMNVDGMK